MIKFKISNFIVTILLFSNDVLGETKSVTCDAILTDYVAEYAWYDEIDGAHSDGIAPLVVFSIKPSIGCGNKEVKILFKSADHENTIPQLSSDIGETYEIKIPADFFDGNALIIESTYVSTLVRKAP
ncbi:hypothetical protein NBRC116493_02610 [Aurantivibrio infirmus]